jgi:hypothetical protein
MTVRASVNFSVFENLSSSPSSVAARTLHAGEAAVTNDVSSFGDADVLPGAATAVASNPASPPASGDGFFSGGCSVGSPANRNMNKPHQVALTVEAESAGGLGGGAQKLQITVKQLEEFGLTGLINKAATQAERDNLVMQLYEKLQVDESGMLTCAELESRKSIPARPESVVLVTRSPLTFFLSLPSGARHFLRLSAHGRPGCELEGLQSKRKEKVFLRINASQLEAMGCGHLWRCSEVERVDMMGALCRQIEIDEETGHMFIPGMPNERMVLPLLEKRRPHEATPEGCASVEWNPLGDLGSGWGSSSGSFDGGSMVSGGHGGGGGGSGGGSGDGVRSAGGGPLGTLDEDSLGDLSLHSWASLTEGGAGVAGGRAGRVSVSAESSNKRGAAWRQRGNSTGSNIDGSDGGGGGGSVDGSNANTVALEEKVLTNVKRALGFPVSERMLRRVIHSMITGEPVQTRTIAGTGIEDAGSTG